MNCKLKVGKLLNPALPLLYSTYFRGMAVMADLWQLYLPVKMFIIALRYLTYRTVRYSSNRRSGATLLRAERAIAISDLLLKNTYPLFRAEDMQGRSTSMYEYEYRR